eukprot:CAMPEP_0113555384 /NCGR_PEP_ID=MMETSP0015_2-20120614/16684_1 /TAXON_ID=2838 /ORGANISM="Odontella" /LENGTH=323 /DNA_ID=CAMNT_0000456649 /DNA_START=105 /DNA_END=1077 /DNA_ORIENTATION=+ /assembly_acc=CAM_ASM_000160
MKLLAAALAAACLLSPGSLPGARASAVRGKAVDAEEMDRRTLQDAIPMSDLEGIPSDWDDVAEAEEDVEPKEGEDPEEADASVETDHFVPPYRTGSCTCAKEAWLTVQTEAAAHLKMLPLVADNDFYVTIQKEINRLLDFAVCFLHSIDCGCEDGHFGHTFKRYNNYKVSTYQCCCDVNAIRDIIIQGMKDVSEWRTTGMNMMTMSSGGITVNSDLVVRRDAFGMLDDIVNRVYKAVLKVGHVYYDATDPGYDNCIEAICPDDAFYLPSDPNNDLSEYSCGATCDRVCDTEGNAAALIRVLLLQLHLLIVAQIAPKGQVSVFQ